MALSEFSEQRSTLQSKMRDYAEMIWEAGGETRISHDAEVQALLFIEIMASQFRERIEAKP